MLDLCAPERWLQQLIARRGIIRPRYRLLLRNVSEDWHRSAKTAAAFEGGTLMPWLVAAMVRCNSGHSNLSSSEVPSGEGYRGEVPPAAVGFTEVCPTEIRPPELCPAEMHPLKCAHRRHAPLRFTQRRCTMVRSAAVRPHLTPKVASRHRCHANTPCLTGYCPLCVVRHGANLASGPLRMGNRGASILHFARRSEAQWLKRLGRGGTLHAFCRGL
jgi:hypothetical protein